MHDATQDKRDLRASNFIRSRIEDDLARGTYAARRWSGAPGDAAAQADAPHDAASIRTRFPPEPNGYLHIGHAKSICLNFGLARDYGGRCHMRFDDTNPVKEDQEYVDAILDAVRWLGFSWTHPAGDGGTAAGGADAAPGDASPAEDNLYFASDYFETLYRFAQRLVRTGHAYVDSQSADRMRESRGTLTEPGRASPFRDRPAAESLDLFARMRAGEFADGAHVLRAKIDMASANLNLRDPVLYRIRRAEHHRTGNDWPIYPMYDYAHPISDALENITHSLCTLEFEDHRPLYDWLLERLAEAAPDLTAGSADTPAADAPGAEASQAAASAPAAPAADDSAGRLAPVLQRPLPQQIEFARLNLTYVITSKRKLQQLVQESRVNGWDDPRMPTIVGLRRRGYTPEAIQLFCERIGVSKSDSWIDYAVLEGALRDDLEGKAPRAMAVLDPLRLVIDNFPAEDAASAEICTAPAHPQRPELGTREIPFGRELWIDAGDFMETPSKGYHRLYPGNLVRLRYGFVVRCTGCDKDASGRIVAVHAEYMPDSKSGTPGADTYKTKGVITWVPVAQAVRAEVRLYERLFTEAQPDAGGRDFLQSLNPDSRRVVTGWLEPWVARARPDERFQFERIGYFVADRIDHRPEAPVFNQAVGLKDSWGR